MLDIEKIISVIDEYLEANKKDYIGAVEANEVLTKKGLLRNSQSRPGKPLRDLLRKGLIPQAYQDKGSKWVIPYSRNLSNYKHLSANNEKELKPESIKKESLSVDKKELIYKLESAREKYKPLKIKYLLIAEAPPDNVERFFYYEDVKNHDYLFLGITEALYPNLKVQYINSGRDSSVKQSILKRFKDEGFYLIDLSELPLSYLTHNLRSQVPYLLEKMEGLIDFESPIIPIKVNVCEIVNYPIINAGFTNLVDISIPFPGQGWQRIFQKKFKEALNVTGYY